MAEVKVPISSTVILSIGPIGSGKSSTAEKIVSHLSDIAKHIDGDKLDLANIKEVMSLKGERNDYTIWLIIKTLMENKIPIISTGGGILFSFGRKPAFELKKRIFAILGIEIRIILLLPDMSIFDFEEYSPEKFNINDVYQKNEDQISGAVVNRVLRGEWDVPENFFPSKKL